MAEVASWLALTLAGAGILYQLATAALLGRGSDAGVLPGESGVTILKPLHGSEPRLLANLSTFVAQDYSGPVQIVFGVQDAADPAIAAVEALRAAHPEADIALVVDDTSHGSNAKVSNLINMLSAAKHELLVLSDSDMVVGHEYLGGIIGELQADSGIGAVTCLYRGRGDAGPWSQLAAMGISYGFLPSVVLGRALSLAEPCMGSTIAIRRDMLDAIGGFESVADILADDYAIGAGVRALGLKVEVSSTILTHACTEASFAELARHELRWNATILRLDPGGYIGLGLMNPLPWALGAILLTPNALPVLAIAVASRLLVAIRADGHGGERAGPLWLLPIRDLLSFGLWFATFFSRSVDWRGTRLDVARDGRLRRS